MLFQDEEVESCSSHGNGQPRPAPRLGNPYDTMVGGTSPPTQHQQQMLFSEPGVYSDPGEVVGDLPSEFYTLT